MDTIPTLAESISPVVIHPARSGGRRIRSVCWSILLIPFLFLPYRFLWFPAGLAATSLIWPRRLTLRQVLDRDGTLMIGLAILLIVREGVDPGWWGPWIAFMAFLC